MRVLETTSAPTHHVLEACASFGLLVRFDRGDGRRRRMIERAEETARSIDQELRPGAIALVVGPSGCGKSTVLDACARVTSGARADEGVDEAPLADLFGGGDLGLLARAGLADPTLLVRTPSQLSVGQRHRLGIARAMQGGALTIIIDELASCLDTETARCTCSMIARWVRSSGRRLIAATAREDVIEVMAPEMIIEPDLDDG